MYLADEGTRSEGVGEVSRMATSAPAATSLCAVLRPMPLLPPVRMATYIRTYVSQDIVGSAIPFGTRGSRSYLAFELLRHADFLSCRLQDLMLTDSECQDEGKSARVDLSP